MAEDLQKYLGKIPVFQGLTPGDIREIAGITLLRRYRKNMIIFVEGEPGDGLYFIKTGRVKISKLLEDGREKTLHLLQEGDIFAEVLLFDGGPFPATAEALEDAEIGLLRREDVLNLLRRNAEITLKILLVMSKRLRQAQVQVRDLAYLDVYGRLALTLCQLAEEHGRDTEQGRQIAFPLSQQELANLVGASRETVARIINDLKRMGIITVGQRMITISDAARLKRWLG